MFIKQLSVFIENKEGRLDEVLNNLSDFPKERADVAVTNQTKFRKRTVPMSPSIRFFYWKNCRTYSKPGRRKANKDTKE